MKKISQIIAVSSMILSLTSGIFAQEGNPKHKDEHKKENFEKIEAAKKEYFTSELKLTEKESEKFWTIYGEYNKAQKANRKQQRNVTDKLRSNLDSIPEHEIKTLSESLLKLEKESIESREKYVSKVSEIIGYKRAIKSLHLEREFKHELINRVKDHKKGKGPHSDRKEYRAPAEK
jgi:tryptophan 2,3-dioxygenase